MDRRRAPAVPPDSSSSPFGTPEAVTAVRSGGSLDDANRAHNANFDRTAVIRNAHSRTGRGRATVTGACPGGRRRGARHARLARARLGGAPGDARRVNRREDLDQRRRPPLDRDRPRRRAGPDLRKRPSAWHARRGSADRPQAVGVRGPTWMVRSSSRPALSEEALNPRRMERSLTPRVRRRDRSRTSRHASSSARRRSTAVRRSDPTSGPRGVDSGSSLPGFRRA